MNKDLRITVKIWSGNGSKRLTNILCIENKPLEEGLIEMHDIVRKII